MVVGIADIQAEIQAAVEVLEIGTVFQKERMVAEMTRMDYSGR